MSMYGDFINECTSWQVFENDDYFFTYRASHDVFFIRNMYIRPEKRKTGVGSILKKHIITLAIESGSSLIAGDLYEENKHYNFLMEIWKSLGCTIFNKSDGTKGKFIYLEIDKLRG